MGVYKKILVAIDLSSESWHALKESLKIIRNEDTWVVIATVVPHYGFESDFDLVWGDFQKKMAKPYEEVLLKAKDYLSQERILAKFVLEEGKPYEKIVDLAYTENCDLIILGKTTKGLKRMLLGSTAAGVIGYSPVDVLVIPHDGKLNLQKILVPFDLSSYSYRAFEKALELSKFYQSELYLLSVIDLPVETMADAPQVYEKMTEKIKKAFSELKTKAQGAGIKCEVELSEGDPTEKILKAAEEKGIGVIVMGSYGKRGLKKLLIGSVTEKVISLGNRPVLVVKA